MMFMGSKYLEYSSSIRIKYNYTGNQREIITRQLTVNNWNGVQHQNRQQKYIYNQLNCPVNLEKITRIARIDWGILQGAQGAYCTKLRKIFLIKSLQIRRFSRWSVGGGWSLLLEAKSLKTSSRDHQAQVHSDHMVLVIAKQVAGPCEQRPNSRDIFSWLRWGVLKGELGTSQKT